MLEASAEERLLRRAQELGLLSADVLADTPEVAVTQQEGYRWGPRLDRLIAQGRLDEAAIRRLAAELSSLAQTLDGSSPGLVSGVGPGPDAAAAGADAAPMELARTVHSGAGSAPVHAPVGVLSFPAPHWERYEFLSLLGRGGMGAVYRARDRRLGRMVALKFILGGDEGTTQRFLQEARSQSRLDHPCICRVYEVGFVDQKPYIALELIEGTTLDRVNLSLAEKIRLFREAAEAVDHAHHQGVIHRDIKPSEVATEREAPNIVPI